MKKKEFHYKAVWTNEVSQQDIRDFLYVKMHVFKKEYDKDFFANKYLKNIYGPSLLIFAYDSVNLCVGTRAFWRNDIKKNIAYQPCDTSVLAKYRGLGIFTSMTKKGLKKIGTDSLIYNYPNDNSLPGYIKLGWKIAYQKKYDFFKGKEKLEPIEEEYLEWIISVQQKKQQPVLFVKKTKHGDLLLKKIKYNFFLVITSLKEQKYSKFLHKVNHPFLLIYKANGYFGRGILCVTKNDSAIEIPIYKIDTLF